MHQDHVVEEIRRIRNEHEMKYDYDFHAICEIFPRRQSISGLPAVSLKPGVSGILVLSIPSGKKGGTLQGRVG